MTPLLRLLELVQRELRADGARAEFATREPAPETTIWTALPGGFRLVVEFDEGVEDRVRLETRLEALVASFSGLAADLEAHAPRPNAPTNTADLDEALARLAESVDAQVAMVIDDRSPMIWGSSAPKEGRLGIAELLALRRPGAGADAPTTRLSRAVARVRRHPASTRTERWSEATHEPGFGYLARSFASIYRVVLVFEGPFSELHVEAAALHALPGIERLVLALPPVDPAPGGGRVLELVRPT